MNRLSGVHAVVVAYHPCAQSFVPLIDVLLEQVDYIHVVDNTGPEGRCAWSLLDSQSLDRDRLFVVELGGNLGIAAALNVGVENALREGADYLLLSDQDSLPAQEMVPALGEAWRELTLSGQRIAAVGPTFTDLHTKITYPFQARVPGKFFYGRHLPTTDEPLVEALTLITSGTLTSREVWLDVGPMREDFFIDYVDIEWCHRARSKGYALYGGGGALMYQRMGEASLRVWYGGWRQESLYSPLRIYFRIRNFVALCRLNYIETRWKVRSSWYSLGLLYSHLVFGRERLKTLVMSTKGLWHGLIGRMGPYRP